MVSKEDCQLELLFLEKWLPTKASGFEIGLPTKAIGLERGLPTRAFIFRKMIAN